jgi:L-lactate permease
MQIRKKGGWNKKKKSSLKLLSQSQPNFAEMILRWSPFKIVSVSAVLYPRWPQLLKIEISANGQNCSILSQKVPKFELYKHNDELFNIYYGIFYELWSFTDFDRLCKLEKGGMKLKKSSSLKLLSQSQPNFAEMILRWSPFKIVSVSAVLYPIWPPLLKIEISSKGQHCSILSQKVPKFELYKHNDELFNIYYRIFLWTLNFCRFWPIMQIRKKGGWN